MGLSGFKRFVDNWGRRTSRPFSDKRNRSQRQLLDPHTDQGTPTVCYSLVVQFYVKRGRWRRLPTGGRDLLLAQRHYCIILSWPLFRLLVGLPTWSSRRGYTPGSEVDVSSRSGSGFRPNLGIRSLRWFVFAAVELVNPCVKF